MNVEQFILLGIGWVFIFVRIFVRWRAAGPSNWELDDYLMPLVGVSYILPFPFLIIFLEDWGVQGRVLKRRG
ncbi:hypothetical protein IMZ48_49175 [Candidatus Bathyarchaeota archaeon]|nr:hypothetical protein [Candidatus Bathyarchaeota archaeon]